jgi:putative zinc-dependent peptidase DUF5700
MKPFLLALIVSIPLVVSAQTSAKKIDIHFQTEEPEAVLAIVSKQAAGQPVTDADWQRLFSTEAYVRLQKREAAIKRPFTDDSFKKFVLSPELAKRAPELTRTLKEWQRADLSAAAQRVLPYLPEQARIRAKVFPMIKPATNSFVFETSTDPVIFLYLDPEITSQKFENTVAHEMHHIGFASIEDRQEGKNLPPHMQYALKWMGAFGEGFAMLAAAGSPDVHPHAVSKPEDRARWDRDMTNFNRDVKSLDEFFLKIFDQKFKTEDEVDEVGFTFFGEQGPWYTVGYKMAVTIEKEFGRAVLIDCMTNPRKLMETYNHAAAEQNKKNGEQLAVWSVDLIKAVSTK